MKVAMVTGGLPFGGSSTFLLYLASGFRSFGIPCQVFSFHKENAFTAEFSEAGIPVHGADEAKLIFEDRMAALYQKIAEFEPTVVIANLAVDSYEMLRYMPVGTVRIGMIHDPVNQSMPPIYKEYLDGIAVVNPSWVEVTNRLAPGLPCRYLAHGIPMPEPNLKRNPNPSRPLSLTYFGRLTEVKGAKLFPEIVRQLRARAIPFHFTIYGNGPDEKSLRQSLVEEMQTGGVVLSPFLSRHELFPTIQKHDVFIMASEVEGGPLTLLEAMAVGLVPVSADIPCLSQEVINSENGFIIPREAAKFAEIFSILHHDRSLLERMSDAARRTITGRYNTRAMAQRYIEFIESLPVKAACAPWPARIKPRPIRGSGFVMRISQGNLLTRQVRRIVKRVLTPSTLRKQRAHM